MPGGFIGNVSLLNFKSRVARRLLDKEAKSVLREAVTAWVKTAESIIPVWSGMSRGTLVKLGQQVGVNISLFVDSGALPPKGPGDRSSQGEGQSEGRLVENRGAYGFVYSSNVFHLAVNENADATIYGFNLRKPGPYRFRDAANRAFEGVLQERLGNFPMNEVIGAAFDVKSQPIG